MKKATQFEQLMAVIEELQKSVNSLGERVTVVEGKISKSAEEAPSSVEQKKITKPKGGKGGSEKAEKAEEPKEPVTKGTLVKTRSGCKLSVTIEDGKGLGEGKKFIKIVFDGIAYQSVKDQLKLNDWKGYYYKKGKVLSYSHFYTEKAYKMALDLIAENH